MASQASSYVRIGLAPRLSRSKSLARIGITQRPGRKDIPPADRAPELVENAQTIAEQIDLAVAGLQLANPFLGREGNGRGSGAFAAILNGAHVFQGIDERFARWGRIEVEPPQQRRCEAKLPPVFPEFGKIDVVGRLGERTHLVIGDFQEVATHCREDDRPNLGIRRCLVEQDGGGVSQLQRRGIKITKRAQTAFLRRRLRIGKDRRGDDVEQIDDVVAGAGLERADKAVERISSTGLRRESDA